MGATSWEEETAWVQEQGARAYGGLITVSHEAKQESELGEGILRAMDHQASLIAFPHEEIVADVNKADEVCP